MTSCTMKGRWHPLQLVAVVAAFLVWVPLGFAVLAWMLWGDRLTGDRMREGYERMKTRFGGFGPDYAPARSYGFGGSTGNAAFDDYRTETLRRLDEERRRLEEEGRAFAEFLANLRRARDKEEFDRFMRERSEGRPNPDQNS